MDRTVVSIPETTYLYRCTHIQMEGDCVFDHGPRIVAIAPLQVDIYPVTNGRYKVFMEETGYAPAKKGAFLRNWEDGTYPPGQENYPVVWVSREDAEAYARWAGGRLPTDEEWQYIAAGPEYRIWPWGNRFDPLLCNHGGGAAAPVDAYPEGASWCGCCDLAGNAWELTAPDHSDGHHRYLFLRGGSYFRAHDHWHVAGGARPTYFHWKMELMNMEMNRSGTVGFRCVYEVAR